MKRIQTKNHRIGTYEISNIYVTFFNDKIHTFHKLFETINRPGSFRDIFFCIFIGYLQCQ